MRILYFTDKHDFPYGEFSKPTSDGYTSLLQEHILTYDWIVSQILSIGPDLVVNLGDTAKTNGYLDALSLNCIQYGYNKIVQACRDVGSDLHWMIGNHDLANDATRIHLLPFIHEKHLKSSAVIEDGIFYFPFYRDWKPAWSKFKDQVQRCHHAFIHMDIENARFNAFTNCKSGINPSEFPPQCQVIGGHFHHPQSLSPSFHLIGSVMYHSFQDEVDPLNPRGIVVETDGKFNRILNPYTSTYHVVKVSDDVDLENKLVSIQHPASAHVRVTYPEDLDPFVQKYRDLFKGFKPVSVRENRVCSVSVPADMPSGFEPARVLDRYISEFPPKCDINDLRSYISKILEMISQKQKSRHHVHIVSWHAENFLSFVNLDVAIQDKCVIHIDGRIEDGEAGLSNGSGKSAMLEPLCWCLFGDLIRNSSDLETKILADEVINNQSSGGCLASVMFVVDGAECQVMRSRKHSVFGSDLRVWCNGSLVAQGLDPAKSYISKLLGANMGIFRQVVMLVDSLSSKFSQLKSRQRMEMLEDVIQLSLYDELYDKANNDLKTAKSNLELSVLMLAKKKSALEELIASKKLLESQVKVVTDSLDFSIQKKIQERSDKLQEIDVLVQTLNKTHSKILEFQNQIDTKISLRNSSNFDSIATQKKIRDIDVQTALLMKRSDEYSSMLNGKCPTCLRTYEPKPEQMEENAKLQSVIQEWVDAKSLWVHYEKVNTESMFKFDSEIRDLRSEYDRAKQQGDFATSQYNRLKSDVSVIDVEISSINNQRQSAGVQLELMESRSVALTTEILDLESKQSKCQSQVLLHEYVEAALNPRGTCRMWLIQDALSTLNDYSVDYSYMISNGRVAPSFTVNGNTIGLETVVSSDIRKYGLSSSGQRRMVDLSIQLALAKLSSKYSGFSSNLLVLDEVDDKLDSSARRHLVDLLEKISTDEAKTILIATHNRDISEHVDTRWVVVQKNGVSMLVAA